MGILSGPTGSTGHRSRGHKRVSAFAFEFPPSGTGSDLGSWQGVKNFLVLALDLRCLYLMCLDSADSFPDVGSA